MRHLQAHQSPHQAIESQSSIFMHRRRAEEPIQAATHSVPSGFAHDFSRVPVRAFAVGGPKSTDDQATGEVPLKAGGEDDQATPSLIWPVDVSGSVVTSCFGSRVLNGQKEFHPGVDIGQSEGTPVYAAAKGSVVIARAATGYGPNYVAISHSATLITGYGHMKSKAVKVNDVVTAGQQIGTVGHEGRSIGSGGKPGDHLHFNLSLGEKLAAKYLFNSNVDPLQNGLSIPSGVPNPKNC